ncbi:GDSL family lipase [Mucilaginibacter conchicola]|uniref:GDSL family lipase n=1 Tax=Mucilaginibacter conchicola TaxID=2303333 RepID=A0A372P031_9SPHI|nr:SGNH/GDSL hydrolase family protein [Mucilaginibacter conchicola]RFZ95474.1 GDSL family lipase [Mucilaginibacter conchicola]
MFWYEDDIKRLEKQRSQLISQPATLFYGSSSIRLWQTLANDFADHAPVNLGFGGSTLAACTWFFDRVMEGYQPQRLIIYAGDNDLGDGRHPEEVFLFFQQLAARVQKRFGALPCYFISLKPSMARWHMAPQFHFTNKIISEEIVANQPNWHFINIYDAMLNADGQPDTSYYDSDGLHLTPKGYALWARIVKSALNS